MGAQGRSGGWAQGGMVVGGRLEAVVGELRVGAQGMSGGGLGVKAGGSRDGLS